MDPVEKPTALLSGYKLNRFNWLQDLAKSESRVPKPSRIQVFRGNMASATIP